MSKYRNNLPQLDSNLFLTDSGLETYLHFVRGVELQEFASFPLLESDAGRDEITSYMMHHIRIARANYVGFVLETPTWRANPDWGYKLGYNDRALKRINKKAVEFMAALRDEHETDHTKMVISGNIGPRGDGYDPDEFLTADEAQVYHCHQVEAFAEAGADMVTALTMTHVGEAAGVVLAAKAMGMPVVISFTTETDGRLPTGQTLGDAIQQVDRITDQGAAYFMINCAHPSHFDDSLVAEEAWTKRIRGVRANASTKSHAELDNCTELDAGNPVELGGQYRTLRSRFPHLTVLGGCCGTDHRHIKRIYEACKMAA